MPPEIATSARDLRNRREHVIAALQNYFAHDDLDVEEFERRVTVAHTSESATEIDALTADLAPLPGAPEPAPALVALIPAGDRRALQTMRGFMSATTRSGPWSVPAHLRVKALMSSSVLDFREARFPPGPVNLEIRAVMSSVEIIVPPGLSVETYGSAIMGTFDEIDRAPTHPDPEATVLRIHGRAVMSAVEVKMRLPGETERQSHRARRETRAARNSART